MRFIRRLVNPILPLVDALRVEVQMWLVLMRFPTLAIDRPSIWRFDKLSALEIGEKVWVGPYTEIIAYSQSPRSSVAGKLILGNGSVVQTGCNIRAAGGIIDIGNDSVLAQGTVIVAANHAIGNKILHDKWAEDKTGVTIGVNCWIGANCVVLPGTAIGDNSVVAAGSVVSKSVPANELWGGIPAHFIRKIEQQT